MKLKSINQIFLRSLMARTSSIFLLKNTYDPLMKKVRVSTVAPYFLKKQPIVDSLLHFTG